MARKNRKVRRKNRRPLTGRASGVRPFFIVSDRKLPSHC